MEDPVQSGRQGRRIEKAARHETDGDSRQEFQIPWISDEGEDLVAVTDYCDWPADVNASAKWLPMNPVPPVSRTLISRGTF